MESIGSNVQNLQLLILAEIHNRLAAIAGYATWKPQPTIETTLQSDGSVKLTFDWGKKEEKV